MGMGTGGLALGLALTLLGAAGCTPIGAVVGAGAMAGTAASEERGLGGAVDDAGIQAEINQLWLSHDLGLFRRVDMTVREGRVLLTGAVPDPETRVEAVRLAWEAEGVREVINEIEVDDTSTLVDQAADAAIATKLETRLMFDRDVRAINYSVDVVNGTVYLMGVAQDQGELNRAVAYARDMRGVRRVISYVRMKDAGA
ncbi:BON domain-containing protein [Roseospira marina]|uniref:BON domain-containing protein n=1 Tax=Roseospira marina TaxID=140057 RepID=A0A5M6IAC5_9PROT|nr:BON domain-containing protein [Roseospira marina]KAA5605102.1 BON domain-containing protein [Roseospira marina]MBB4314851.1 osmotically-inducible protein OsmY [Roseospira marina]MBB5087851.1 osmotically-inducible protein OsmY [Roseospira marina]